MLTYILYDKFMILNWYFKDLYLNSVIRKYKNAIQDLWNYSKTLGGTITLDELNTVYIGITDDEFLALKMSEVRWEFINLIAK